MSIPMTRDQRDAWPENAPRGTFDIEPCSLEGRPAVTAHMTFVCPHGRVCGMFLGPTGEARRTADEPPVWQWNGNAERPTLSPSFNCVATTGKDGKPAGGCGWHGFIRDGTLTG